LSSQFDVVAGRRLALDVSLIISKKPKSLGGMVLKDNPEPSMNFISGTVGSPASLTFASSASAIGVP
jgi:hypothetical protein